MNRMPTNYITRRAGWAAPSAVATIVAVTSFIHQPSYAQLSLPGLPELPGLTALAPPAAATTTTTAAKEADACLSRPGAAGPRGTHWYYRIERPSGRRCWYLGSADAKARRAATSERKLPTPSPRPEEAAPRDAATDIPALTPGDIEARDANSAPVSSAAPNSAAATPSTHAPNGHATDGHAADGHAASAPGLPTAWSAGPGFPNANNHDEATPPAEDSPEAAATSEAHNEQNEMPLVWPVEQASVAQPFDSMPGVASLVIFLAAAGAFVAIAFRAVLQLWTGWFARRAHRPVVTEAAPIIRRRAPSQPSAEHITTQPTIESMTEPTITRLREIAARWDARVPRTARTMDRTMDQHAMDRRLAGYDDEPRTTEHNDDWSTERRQEPPTLRRRRAVA